VVALVSESGRSKFSYRRQNSFRACELSWPFRLTLTLTESLASPPCQPENDFGVADNGWPDAGTIPHLLPAGDQFPQYPSRTIVSSAPVSDRPVGLRPPQFGLRTLLLAVTACAVLLAVMQWLRISLVVAASLVFLAITVGLHVLGNVVGTRLRQIGSQPDTAMSDLDARATRALQPADFAPATRLGARHSLGWVIIAATLAAALAGGIGGGVWTALAGRGAVPWANIGVGCIAFGSLSGLAGFGATALTMVLWSAISQAHSNPSPSCASRGDQTRPG
jgi:hypothetical protein